MQLLGIYTFHKNRYFGEIKIVKILDKHCIKISALILLSIIVLSLYPLETLPSVPGSDKTHHFIAYGTLAFPMAFSRPKYWFFYILFFLLCGGLIELIQPYVNRYGEWLDMLANTVGLLLGTVIGIITRKLLT